MARRVVAFRLMLSLIPIFLSGVYRGFAAKDCGELVCPFSVYFVTANVLVPE